MEQQALINSFIENLSELNGYLGKLSTLLVQEESALTEQNLAATEEIAAEKNQLTAHVEQAEKLRQSLCVQLQITPDKRGMQHWLKTQSVEIQQQVTSLWQQITRLGQKCNSQNQINGILVAHLQRHTQDALAVLRGAVTGQDSYSQTGSPENKQNQKIIAKA